VIESVLWFGQKVKARRAGGDHPAGRLPSYPSF